MPDDQDVYTPHEIKKIGAIFIIGFVILSIVTIGSYLYAKQRTGTTVLPGGVTYLGPSPTPHPQSSGQTMISIPTNATWVPNPGKIFPYTFMYPNTLSLGVFPGDPFDSVTLYWGNTNAQENMFLRVEDLNKLKDMNVYINKSKKEYANIWWKQYNWKGVASVDSFTNSKGMKGYRAKYVNDKGQTPFDNIFFEIPKRAELVVWMGSRLLDNVTFDKMVESFYWDTTTR